MKKAFYFLMVSLFYIVGAAAHAQSVPNYHCDFHYTGMNDLNSAHKSSFEVTEPGFDKDIPYRKFKTVVIDPDEFGKKYPEGTYETYLFKLAVSETGMSVTLVKNSIQSPKDFYDVGMAWIPANSEVSLVERKISFFADDHSGYLSCSPIGSRSLKSLNN